MAGDRLPEAGDLAMCIICTSMLRFDAELRLEALPDAEFRALPAVVQDHFHTLRRMIHDFHAERNTQSPQDRDTQSPQDRDPVAGS